MVLLTPRMSFSASVPLPCVCVCMSIYMYVCCICVCMYTCICMYVWRLSGTWVALSKTKEEAAMHLSQFLTAVRQYATSLVTLPLPLRPSHSRQCSSPTCNTYWNLNVFTTIHMVHDFQILFSPALISLLDSRQIMWIAYTVRLLSLNMFPSTAQLSLRIPSPNSPNQRSEPHVSSLFPLSYNQ